MVKTLIKYISQFLLLPLLEKFGRYIHAEYEKWRMQRKIISEEKAKSEAVKNAQSPEEIREAHRRASRFDS